MINTKQRITYEIYCYIYSIETMRDGVPVEKYRYSYHIYRYKWVLDAVFEKELIVNTPDVFESEDLARAHALETVTALKETP